MGVQKTTRVTRDPITNDRFCRLASMLPEPELYSCKRSEQRVTRWLELDICDRNSDGLWMVSTLIGLQRPPKYTSKCRAANTKAMASFFNSAVITLTCWKCLREITQYQSHPPASALHQLQRRWDLHSTGTVVSQIRSRKNWCVTQWILHSSESMITPGTPFELFRSTKEVSQRGSDLHVYLDMWSLRLQIHTLKDAKSRKHQRNVWTPGPSYVHDPPSYPNKLPDHSDMPRDSSLRTKPSASAAGRGLECFAAQTPLTYIAESYQEWPTQRYH